jgi:hypothetical protein
MEAVFAFQAQLDGDAAGFSDGRLVIVEPEYHGPEARVERRLDPRTDIQEIGERFLARHEKFFPSGPSL